MDGLSAKPGQRGKEENDAGTNFSTVQTVIRFVIRKQPKQNQKKTTSAQLAPTINDSDTVGLVQKMKHPGVGLVLASGAATNLGKEW